MATNDKHSQTVRVKSGKITKIDCDPAEYAKVMYDETVPVSNAPDIESPPESGDEVRVKSAMSKFNPPTRHDLDDFSSESEDFVPNKLSSKPYDDDSPDRKTNEDVKDEISSKSSKDSYGFGKSISRQQSKQMESSDNSESDSNDLEVEKPDAPPLLSGRKRGAGVVIPTEGTYDPKMYQDLKVPPELDNVFQFISQYTPQKMEIDFKLQPFLPEYVPAVGDIDAFIKVATPAASVRGAAIKEHVLEHIDNLGLAVLDEPSAEQSDSALLHLQLRALSKTSSARATVLTKKIENAESNPKAIDRWIKDVSELHLSKPAPNFNYTSKMPDIDSLMEEWPEGVEDMLNEVGFPPSTIDCSLTQYVDLVCALFNIPVPSDTINDRIQSLHMLFSLYSAVKSSQLFAEREKEKSDAM